MSKMPKILVLCPYPEDHAPSQRFKFEQYYPSWRAAGFEVDVRPFWSKSGWQALYSKGKILRKLLALVVGFWKRLGDVRDACRADLVYIHLEIAPLGPPVWERKIHRAGVPIVYDIDDLVHLPHGSPANPFMTWLRAQNKVQEILSLARHIIVCTEYLKSFALKYNSAVTNISSTINTDTYQPKPHRNRTKGVVIGWSGSHSTAPYLHLLDEVLQSLNQTEDIQVKVIGDAHFHIPNLTIEAQSWRGDTEVEDLSGIDIGLYPLPDEEWILGKSGLKALQYMALEIPTVAQRIGTNLTIIEEGKNGLLADSPSEWEDALRRLVRDPALRERLGKEARKTVMARYSVHANEEAYLGTLRETLTSSLSSSSS